MHIKWEKIMPTPERLEDLGRIREKLERLFDESLALEAGSFHDEHFEKVFKNEEKLMELFRSLRYLREELSKCSCIANGYDN